ncbi:MAG TPA: GFA family protein [Hyphomicrobiaceae bacterium]|nr:GFA family protein [Hyphomicrobiaceae bacterium]
MTIRRAACSCGQLNLTIEGEPSRVSMCHCLECQRRTGAVLSNQARFKREQITFAGQATAWTRTADSGNALTFHFCPVCGSTVYWEGQGFAGLVAVAIGTFADPNFPAPNIAVWEETRHPWVSLPPDTPPAHAAQQG